MPLPCHYCLTWRMDNQRCAKCKSVFYCCKECQAKDWKHGSNKFGVIFPNHQSICREMKEDELRYRLPDEHDKDVKSLHQDVYHLHELSAIAEHWTRFRQLSEKRAKAFNNPWLGYSFDESQEMTTNWFMTFRSCYSVGAHIQEMMFRAFTHPDLKPGQIIPNEERGGMIRECSAKSAIRNRPAIKLNMFMGETYVAVGFVDLTQLLTSNIHENGKGPLRYIGIESDYQKFVRTNIIYGMMKNKECGDKTILQVMYSFIINKKAKEWVKSSAFEFTNTRYANEHLSHEKKLQVMSLIRKYDPDEIKSQILDYLYEEMSMSNLLKSRKERLQFYQFISTHALFTDIFEDFLINPTMFTMGDLRKTKNGNGLLQSFFRQFDLSWLESVKDEDDFFNCIERCLLGKIRKLRELIWQGKVECTFIHRKVGEVDTMKDDARLIRNFNPSVIDWSSLIDYFNTEEFLEWIKKCGSEDTVHAMYIVDWHREVYGAFPQMFLCEDDQMLVNAFDASRRQFRQDWKRVLREKPYLEKVFYTDGLLFQSLPLIELIWSNYMKFRFIEYADKLGKDCDGLRVVKVGNTDQWHVPANYGMHTFDMALVSQRVHADKRQELVKKYVQI